jgi:RND family efflux transporter MFP subunit
MRAVAVCLIAACASEAQKPEEVPRFRVASPEVRDAVVEREYVAEVRAVRYAEVRSRFKGILEAVAVDEGQAVTAGKTLFMVNARALKQEVLVARAVTLGAEAELKAAQLELQNTKLLQEKNVVSHAELSLAESKVQTLRAKVEEAKATAERAAVEVGYAEIKAPFNGVINRVPKKAGSAIAEDELLTTITDTSEVFAYFRITEREYLELVASSAGDQPRTVGLRLADGTAFSAEGVIDAIESEFDRETGTLAYRARFTNPAGTLKHGSSGKVVIKTELRNALLVPQKSTFDVQGDLYLYVLDPNDVVGARRIGVKARVNEAFVVDRGIAREERFVLDGVQKVRDGQRIEVAPPAAARASASQGG